jgi:hypothetical protein
MVEKYETLSHQDIRMDERKSKAIIAFLPYAARQEKNGTGELSNAFSRVVGFSLYFKPAT